VKGWTVQEIAQLVYIRCRQNVGECIDLHGVRD
jgi:hypothetical protein